MDAISLFSGAGGMDLGFRMAGFETVTACEMNADACDTFEANGLGPVFRGSAVDLVADIRPGDAAVLFGGPPCQGISVAGKMDPQDPRSTLMETYFDAVDRVRPLGFVMENVDALMMLEKWRPRLETIRTRAEASGYGVALAVLDASSFGVPQKRRRFFAVGVRDARSDHVSMLLSGNLERFRRRCAPARTVFERLGPQGSVTNHASSRAVITPCKNPVLRKSPYAGMLFNGAGRPIDPERPAPTMTASAGGNKTHIVDEAQVFEGRPGFAAEYHAHLAGGGRPGEMEVPPTVRRLTLSESAAFQGFPADFTFKGRTSSVYRQIGNAVPVGLAEAVATAFRLTLADLSRPKDSLISHAA